MVFLPAWTFTCCWKLEATVCGKDRITVLPASSARKKKPHQSSVKRVFLVKVSAPPPPPSDSSPFYHVAPWTAELEPGLPQAACVATSTSDPLTLATFWPRGAARLLVFLRLYLGRVCCCAAPSAFLPSLLRRASNTNWQRPSPLSSLLSSLPFPSPNTVFFFSLPPRRQKSKKKLSQIILPPAVTAAALSTPSHFSVSPVAKKNTMPRGSGGKYLPEPVLLSLHFLLLFPAFIYLFPSFITASASWPLSFSLYILTSSVF